MIDLDDIRQDIFDIKIAPKVLYVYRGDTFELDLSLTISSTELNSVVLNCDGLPEAIPLTLLETTDVSSKWHLVLNKSQTLILAPKTHDFTITIVRTDGTELTLYKGIIAVNNRVYSNYSNNYYIAALLKQTVPTTSDNEYLIGTMWVNVLTDRVYFLTSVVNNEAKWIDYSDQLDKLNIRIDDLKQADAAVLQEAKDYTYSQVEIDNKDTAIMNKANNLENANMLKDVVYNNLNGVLTFTRYDDTTKQIDLPLELIVTSGYYDEAANELVLVLANSSEIRIPVDNLLTDLDAHNIRFNGSGTNYLVNKNDVESAVKELDTRVKTNADNVALKVNTSDIVNNLISTNTNKPLSANQGKVLNDTTAKLASSNVFTQPQQVPNATLPQHATNKLQVETMFEMFKQQLRGYNLAIPDLTGKEYLGNGEYRLVSSTTGGTQKTMTYDVMNGIYNLVEGNPVFSLFTFKSGETYTVSMKYISGERNSQNNKQTISIFINEGVGYKQYFKEGDTLTFTATSDSQYLSFQQHDNEGYNNMCIKLQIEKGDTATSYILPGQIPEYALKQQEAWITPTLLNGWVNTAGQINLQYKKSTLGVVYIRGTISAGTSVSIMTLPSGYRPSGLLRIPVSFGVNPGTLDISAGGQVSVNGAVPFVGNLLINISFIGEA